MRVHVASVLLAVLAAASLASAVSYLSDTELDKVFAKGRLQGSGQTKINLNSGDGAILKQDILDHFNPWRALTVDRKTVWKVGKPPVDELATLKKELEDWWKEDYPFDYTEGGRRANEAKGYAHQKGDAYSRVQANIYEKQCKYEISLKPDGKGVDIKNPVDDGVCPNFKKLQMVHYYAGLLFGWMDANDELGVHLRNQAKIMFEMSLNVNIKPGFRGRSGGWHVDVTYSQAEDLNKNKGNLRGTTGACAPTHFVLANKFPTLFFTKRLDTFFQDRSMPRDAPNVMKELESFNCLKDSTHPGDKCNNRMLADVFGFTYQPASFEVKRGALPAHVWDDEATKQEPAPQFTEGYFNQYVMDGSVRPFGKPAKGDLGSFKGEISAETDTSYTYQPPESRESITHTFGGNDNPCGGDFRKRFKGSELAKGAVVPAAEAWEMALMEGYRLHLAAVYPKAGYKTHCADLAPTTDADFTSLFPNANGATERFFVRVAIIPKHCFTLHEAIHRLGQQRQRTKNDDGSYKPLNIKATLKQLGLYGQTPDFSGKANQQRRKKLQQQVTSLLEADAQAHELARNGTDREKCMGEACFAPGVLESFVHTD